MKRYLTTLITILMCLAPVVGWGQADGATRETLEKVADIVRTMQEEKNPQKAEGMARELVSQVKPATYDYASRTVCWR
jgi:hypothetical protein